MPDAPSSATWEWTVTSDRVAYSAAWHALLGDAKGNTTESLHAWLGGAALCTKCVIRPSADLLSASRRSHSLRKARSPTHGMASSGRPEA